MSGKNELGKQKNSSRYTELGQVGEEPSLGAALTLFQKHNQAWWQGRFSCQFYDAAGLDWLLCA